MKPLQGNTVSNESCSCTSCIVKSDSVSSSLIRLLEQRSKIDRILNGKLIPVKESKLLEKLIRTRALYEDIRNQLLSSSLSVSSQTALEPGQAPVVKQEALEKTNKPSDILSLVDLVERGSALGPMKISECCSCCNCSSKERFNVNVQKGRKHAHVGGYIASKSSVNSKPSDREESRLEGSVKTKNIKSDPCTCACDLGEMIKQQIQSRIALKKIRPEQPTPGIQHLKRHSIIKDKQRLINFHNEKLKESYHKLKRSKVRPTQYIENMGEGANKTIRKLKESQDELEAHKNKRSAEKLRLAQHRIKENIIPDLNVIQKHRPLGDLAIKKNAVNNDVDSKKVLVSRIKDKNDGGKLEVSTQNTQLKQKQNTRKPKKDNVIESINRNKNVTSTSNVSIRKDRGTPTNSILKQQKIRFRKPSRNVVLLEPNINVEIAKNSKGQVVAHSYPIRKANKTTTPLIPREKTKSVKSMTVLSPVKSIGVMPIAEKKMLYDNVPMRFVPNRRLPEKPVKSVSTSSIDKKPAVKNAVSITLQTDDIKSPSPLQLNTKDNENKDSTIPSILKGKKYDVQSRYVSLKPRFLKKPSEAKKVPLKKNKHAGSHALKRCVCTLKLKVKNTKSKINKKITERSNLTKRASECECSNINNTKEEQVTKEKPIKTSKPKVIKHKQSQISNSTRTKFTNTKHRLRRCVCTLTLGKLEKKKKVSRKLSKETKIQYHPKNASRSTLIKETNTSQSKHIISPYECAPGLCTPGECYPPKCKETIIKRESSKLRRRIKTYANIKTNSTSSLQSRSQQLPKVRKIHSLITTHKSEDTVRILEKKKDRLRLGSTNQIRPSFAITFLKKHSTASESPNKNVSKNKTESVMRPLKDPGKPRDNIKVSPEHPRRDKKLLGSKIKRCLYSVMAHKGKHKMKISTSNTDSKIFVHTATTNLAKTPNYFVSHLRPYECEPYTCVPKECDPYKCLKRIKKRNLNRSSNDLGIVTQKAKMISKSSETRKFEETVDKSYLLDRNSAKQSLRKISKYPYLPKRSSKVYLGKPVRHGFRISSNFSFQILLSKDLLPEKDLVKESSKRSKSRVEEIINKTKYRRKYLKSSRNAARVRPMPKRCFCTLKFQKDEQRRNSKLFSPFTPTTPTQVYAVSTVTVAESSTMKSPKMLLLNKVNLDSHCKDVYSTSYTKKALRQIEQWKYIGNKESTSVISVSTVAYTRSGKKKTYVCKSKRKLLKSHKSSDVASKKTVRFESEFSCEFNYSNNINLKTDTTLRQQKYPNGDALNAPKIMKRVINDSQLTGIQPLLRRCYCTMNIQVATHENPRKKHYQHNYHRRKLKNYECEPGVCEPYECDPYECQKMIMKRLMRKVSRMSGTDRRLRDNSSITSTISSSTRKIQSKGIPRERPTGLKYQTLPRSLKAQKQALRVGSTSCTCSFSKDASKAAPAPTEFVRMRRRPSTSRSSRTYDRHRRNRGTGYRPNRRHRESQSMMTQMRHRASSVTPMLKRCFCTLKLQKKGRQQKERELEVSSFNQGTSTPPECQADKPILRQTGQNTKAKRYKDLSKRRKKRTREFGTESMSSNITSCSCMTPRSKRSRDRYVQSRRHRVRHIQSRDTAVISKPSLMSIKRPSLPSRQSVRIGSSFSFNVEFFKDKDEPSQVIERRPLETYVQDRTRKVRKVPKYVHAHRRMRDGYSQDSRSTRDSESQMGLVHRVQSTMTNAFLKRCFGTAKLHGIKVNAETRTKSEGKDSFLKRCFCVLKSVRTSKKVHDQNFGTESQEFTPLVGTHAHTQTRKYRQTLAAYECEPGICVPGFFDPYDCEKLLRKRHAKEKMTGTTRPRSRSTSSYMSSQKSKARMTQSPYFRERSSEIARYRPPREVVVREVTETPVGPRKQAVRIGSSFSFNIEFHKDSSPNYNEVPIVETLVKRSRPRRRYHTHAGNYANIPRTRHRRLGSRSYSLRSRESQMYGAKKADKSFGPLLKRCFCTLKLYKQRQARKEAKMETIAETKNETKSETKNETNETKNDTKNKTKKEKPSLQCQCTETPASLIKEVPILQNRSVMTTAKYKPYARHRKLEPYECEPGVYVPGECDPYDCEKRIKRRHINRASGTDRYRTRSTSNMIKPRRRYRDRDVQSIYRPRHTVSRAYGPRYIESRVLRPSRQAVKIGSNFSFDIEFFKNKSPSASIPSSRPRAYSTYERPRKTISRSTGGRSVSSRNRTAQGRRSVRDNDSQVLARKMRSTMTGVGPFLKRCFCTLQLYKSQNDTRPFEGVSVATKTEKVKYEPSIDTYNAEKSTLTRKQYRPYNRNLEPHECQCYPHLRNSQRTQARSYEPNQRRIRTGKEELVTYDSSPNQQAVRIGSNFSFNIEFFKDGTPQVQTLSDVHDEPKIKYNKYDTRGTGARYRRTRSTSSYGGRRHLRSCHSQSDCIKTDCKGSCAPLLKRCFCTVKLQKMGRHQHYSELRTESMTRSMATGTPIKNRVEIIPVAREIGTKTKKYNHVLEPYECEKRIRLGNMRNFSTETNRAYMKSMSSLTSRDQGTKAMNTYFPREKGDQKRKPSIETIYRSKQPRVSHIEPLNRQSVHLGSNFSFNIEFYKDKPTDHIASYQDEVQTYYKPNYKSRTNISTEHRIHKENQGSHGREPLHYHRTQVGASTESRGSGMAPLLKRCFCTLTLQRAEVKNTLHSPSVKSKYVMKPKHVVQHKPTTQEKSTSTKNRYIPSPAPATRFHNLEPYECEPYVCVPGQCDPYECLERIKRRGIRRISRLTGTRMTHPSQASVSSIASQFMPGFRSRRTQLREAATPQHKVERIVEEPRFPFLHGGPGRQAVRISSNFSFNIEFFKELPPDYSATVCKQKELCQSRDVCTECKRTDHSKLRTRIGQHNPRYYDQQSQDSQSEQVRTEEKSSAAALLRRCFCTAKLHRKHLARTYHPQSLTVGRVEEIRPLPLFGPKEYWVQYQTNHVSQQPVKCMFKNKKTLFDKPKTATIMEGTDPNNQETIMTGDLKTAKKPTIKGGKLEIKPPQKTEDTKSNTSTFKKILCRCKYYFAKQTSHSKKNEHVDKINSTTSMAEHMKSIQTTKPKSDQADNLKLSISERHPNISSRKKVKAVLKKSKSLKVASSNTDKTSSNKRTFSRFQSGDASQKHSEHFVNKICLHCQAHFKQAIPNKKVHFSMTPKKQNDNVKNKISKPNNDTVPSSQKESKSVSILFKSPLKKTTHDLKCLRQCACCDSFETKRAIPMPSNALDAKTKINKGEKLTQNRETENQHEEFCRCCVCKSNGFSITSAVKGTQPSSNASHSPPKHPRVRVAKKKPCVCGSLVCKKRAEAKSVIANAKSRRSNRKVCVCGAKICASESKKEAKYAEKGFKRVEKKKKSAKKLRQELKQREKMYKKDDKALRKKRKENEKYMIEKAKKYRNTSDALLVAESVLDIAQLGLTSAGDIVRTVSRAILDPKRTYQNLRMCIKDPTRAWKKIQDAADNGPGVATLKRLKLRFKALSCVKDHCMLDILEGNPITNYVVHCADPDPKHRLHPKKRVRRRQDPTFACYTFMLSLRKKPWLSVYYKCPWFYPHCLSLLQIWRQFSDVLLFLLAVAVWCPCILTMELCRAMMCCCLCTG